MKSVQIKQSLAKVDNTTVTKAVKLSWIARLVSQVITVLEITVQNLLDSVLLVITAKLDHLFKINTPSVLDISQDQSLVLSTYLLIK